MEQYERFILLSPAVTFFNQKKEEFLLLQKQAHEGNANAQYHLGLCYLYGQNTEMDFNEAYQWIEKAALQGDKIAGLFLGYFHELGIGCEINYAQAIDKYRTYSPSVSEVDKTALWEEVKKIDKNEIENKLSEIYNKANHIRETIIKITDFWEYDSQNDSYNTHYRVEDSSGIEKPIEEYNKIVEEFKIHKIHLDVFTFESDDLKYGYWMYLKPLEEYNKLVEEFKIYLDAYTSDSDDEKYGYWTYLYEDVLNLTGIICNALMGRYTLYQYFWYSRLLNIDDNKYFLFALGRCLKDDDYSSDNDDKTSGLLLVASHDDDPVWQNRVGLWYEFGNENKDLLLSEYWYKKAACSMLPEAKVNIDRLKWKKEYKIITDKTVGLAEDRLKIAKTIKRNKELRNRWLLSAATMGNENAMKQLSKTIDVDGDHIYYKTIAHLMEKIELEKAYREEKNESWKEDAVAFTREYFIELKKKEEEERKKTAEEEARKKAEEEERRRREDVDALFDEEPNTKKWLWILLSVLIFGWGVWYFYQNSGWSKDRTTQTEAVDPNSESISEGKEDAVGETPASPLAFLEGFYKGEIGDEGYIEQYVTTRVLKKLKHDYDYECPSNDCLATWVFTAYPAGADLDQEEGPIITKTDEEGKYKVDFKYSGYNGDRKTYETRTVYLTVSEVDGKYVISDYEVIDGDVGVSHDFEDADDNQGNASENSERNDNPQDYNRSLEDNKNQVKNAIEAKQHDIEKQETQKSDDMNVYEVVDRPPSYPGGMGALMSWLNQNVKYPVTAAENGVQGRVIVQFVVEKDGSVTNVGVAKSVDPALDKEAVRVVKSMPHWNPGKSNGSTVRVKHTVPVIFRLQ